MITTDTEKLSEIKSNYDKIHEIDNFSDDLLLGAQESTYDFVICSDDLFPRIQASFTCPIFVVCKMELNEKWVSFLEMGADGILSENHSIYAIMNQALAFLRRYRRTTSFFHFGIEINFEQSQAFLNGIPFHLTLTELKILNELAKNPVMPRHSIYPKVFGKGGHLRSLDVHICSLRKKLKAHGIFIESVRNVGYRLTRYSEASTPTASESWTNTNAS